MKRFFMIFMVALTVLTLGSCGALPQGGTQPDETTAPPPPTANDIFAKVEAAMDALDSYEASGSLAMVVYVSGNRLDGTADIRQVETGVVSGDYYYYNDMKLKMTSETLGVKEMITSMEAYHNGNAFVSTKSDSVRQMIYSPMTSTDYRKYKEEQNNAFDDDSFTDCTTSSFTENADGTWEIRYTGYTKKALAPYLEAMGFDGELYDHDVIDMEVIIQADAEYRITQMIMRMIFDVDEGATTVPVMETVMNYSAYNAATRIVNNLGTMSYTEVEDIRLLAEFERMIETLQASKQNTFTLDVNQVFSAGGQKSVYKEKDIITYGEAEGAYFYDILAEANGESIEIEYKNGTQSIRANGTTQTEWQTQDAAKAYISGLINTAGYDKQYVYDIEKTDDTTYTLTLKPPQEAAYKQILESAGITYKSATQKIIFTVKDGSLIRAQSTVEVKGEYKVSNRIYSGKMLTITSDAVFEE